MSLAVALTGPAAQAQTKSQAQTKPPAPLDCISDWSDAAPIVRREGLAPMELVDRLARDRSSVQVVRGTLCKDHDRYVYRLTVRGDHGTLRTLFVDARRPFEH